MKQIISAAVLLMLTTVSLHAAQLAPPGVFPGTGDSSGGSSITDRIIDGGCDVGSLGSGGSGTGSSGSTPTPPGDPGDPGDGGSGGGGGGGSGGSGGSGSTTTPTVDPDEARKAYTQTMLSESSTELATAKKEGAEAPAVSTATYKTLMQKMEATLKAATELLSAAKTATEATIARSMLSVASLGKKQLLQKVGDPVLPSTGEYVDETQDLLITANTLQYPVLRSYRTGNTITGSLGYGWISSLDQRLILGIMAGQDDVTAAAESRIAEITEQIEALQKEFSSTYGSSSLSTAKSLLQKRKKKAASALTHAQTALTKAKNAQQAATSGMKDTCKRAVDNAQAACTTWSDRVNQYTTALNSIDQDWNAITALKTQLQEETQDYDKFLQACQSPGNLDLNQQTRFPGTPDWYYQANPQCVTLISATGYPVRFIHESADLWMPYTSGFHPADWQQLQQKADGSWTLTLRNGTVEQYSEAGFLSAVTDRNGNQLFIDRDQETGTVTHLRTSTGEDYIVTSTDKGLITAITSSRDQSLTITYQYSGDLLTRFTDEDEYATTFRYDSHRILQEVQKADGSRIRQEHAYTADGACQVISVTDEEGNTEYFDYDDQLPATTYTDADGMISRYLFDDEGRTLKKTDGNGTVTTWNWSDSGLLQAVTVQDKTIRYTYNRYGDLVRCLYPDGSSETWNWNDAGDLLSYEDSSGVTIWQRDDKGNCIMKREPGKNDQTFFYDRYGRMIRGNGALYTWDQWGNLNSVQTKDCLTSYRYDNRNRLTATLIDGELTERISYAPRETTIEQDNGLKTVLKFNNRHDLTVQEQTDLKTGENRCRSFTYDKAHRVLSEQLNQVPVAACRYTKGGKLEADIRFDQEQSIITCWTWEPATANPTVRTVFSCIGPVNQALYAGTIDFQTVSLADLMKLAEERHDLYRFSCITVPESALPAVPQASGSQQVASQQAASQLAEGTESRVYDNRGRLVRLSTSPASSRSTVEYLEEYRYTDQGTTIIQTLGNAVQTVYRLNAFGEIISRTDGVGNTTRFTTTPQGNCSTVTLPAGNTTTYRWSATGNLVQITFPDGSWLHYRYNALGKAIEVTGSTGFLWQGTWDQAGNLTSQQEFPGLLTRYDRDAAGNLTAVTINGFPADLERYLAASDESFLLPPDATLTWNSRGMVTSAATPATDLTFTWNTAGLLESATDRKENITTAWSYDGAGRVSRCTTRRNGNVIRDVRYTWDANSNLKEIKDREGTPVLRLTYDSRDREIERVFGNGVFCRTRYDADGRITGTSTFSPRGELLQADVTVFEEGTGRIAATCTDEGCLTVYHYDSQGRLSSIQQSVTEQEAGSGILQVLPRTLTRQLKAGLNAIHPTLGNLVPATALMKTEQYTYDRQGNRQSVSTATGTTRYDYDTEDHLLQITGPAGTADITRFTWDQKGNLLAEETAQDTIQYTYDRGNRMIKAEIRRKGAEESTVTTYTYDALGRRYSSSCNGTTCTYLYDGITWNCMGELTQGTGQPVYRTRWTGSTADVVPSQNAAFRSAAPAGQSETFTSRVFTGDRIAGEWNQGTVRYFSCDRTGSIRMETDRMGNPLITRSYTAFGIPRQ